MDRRFTDIIQLIKQSRRNAIRAVNAELIYESTPKTHFYSEWLQNPISSLSCKIFPQRSLGYACGQPTRFAVHSLEGPPDLHPSGSFAHPMPRS
ncbi:MAG: hypothetical protein EA411_10800 [Saprospirales bacterium]|nr:MAG: hypothetical protein EA411_10800 [Saprospirales bacterium]